MSDRIPAGTKCIIKTTPEGSTLYAGLAGQSCTADEKNTEGGSRKTGTQLFNLVGAGAIFGNGDSGFTVVPA